MVPILPPTSQPISIVLVGLGSAGRARLQAVQDSQHFQLAGLVSRRPGIGTRSWEAVLADPQVEAIAISTENPHHAQAAQQALQAKKHVLCDYPLAFSKSKLQELLQLAQTQQRVLHVEHIGLLTTEHQALRKQRASLGPLISGEYIFQGGWNPKLADPHWMGPPAFAVISRLMQLTDLLGPVQISFQEGAAKPTGFFLHLHLNFEHGGQLQFTEERRAGLARRRSLLAQCQQGILQLKMGPGKGGLFLKDLNQFAAQILHQQSPYYKTTHLISLTQQLETLPFTW